MNESILREFTSQQLKEELNRRSKVRMGIHYEILEVVCNNCGISTTDVLSQSRMQHICEARNITFYILHKHYGLASTRVAYLLGKKTHVVVLHGCKIIEKKMNENIIFKSRVQNLIQVTEALQ